ncbi:uncharacterized protein EDB91DRAFT_1333086, partial [Suillus paluster]|uniref:uncharacterized protein n=1 Tax=Suillus paluster TaxID=48578 RepID=UPI001B8626BB
MVQFKLGSSQPHKDPAAVHLQKTCRKKSTGSWPHGWLIRGRRYQLDPPAKIQAEMKLWVALVQFRITWSHDATAVSSKFRAKASQRLQRAFNEANTCTMMAWWRVLSSSVLAGVQPGIDGFPAQGLGKTSAFWLKKMTSGSNVNATRKIWKLEITAPFGWARGPEFGQNGHDSLLGETSLRSFRGGKKELDIDKRNAVHGPTSANISSRLQPFDKVVLVEEP